MLHKLEVGRGTSETVITAAVTQLVQKVPDFFFFFKFNDVFGLNNFSAC